MYFSTNEVPPISNNKNDKKKSVSSDKWVYYDPPTTSNNQVNTLKNDVKMPSEPKNVQPRNTPIPKITTNKPSTKSKKKKMEKAIPVPLSFDQLLEDLNCSILLLNFTKFLQFLESKNDQMCFPFISKHYENVFKMITWDINVLRSKSLDASYREVCDKIIETVNSRKSIFSLACAFEYRKEYKNVLVIKKVFLKPETTEDAHKISSSLESLPSAGSSNEPDPDKLLKRSNSPDCIINSLDTLKLHCLKTSLAFVKNDEQMFTQFEELNTEQAETLYSVVGSALSYDDFNESFVDKELYTALVEAIKIFRLKYNFRNGVISTWRDNNVLVIKKVFLEPETTEDAHKISSSLESLPSCGSSNEPDPDELLKRSDSPDSIINSLDTLKRHCLKTSLAFVKNDEEMFTQFEELNTEQAETLYSVVGSALSYDDFSESFVDKELYTALVEAIKIFRLKYNFRNRVITTWRDTKTLVFEKLPKNVPVKITNFWEIPKKKTKKMRKAQKKAERISKIVDLVKRLPSTFVLQALNQIIEFLSNDEWTLTTYLPKTEDELNFYLDATTWAQNNLAGEFDPQYRKLFYNIRDLLNFTKLKIPNGRDSKKKNAVTGFREVTYKKNPMLIPPPSNVPITAQGLNKKKNKKRKNSVTSDISTDRSVTSLKSVSKKKKKKLNSDGTITSLTPRAPNTTKVESVSRSNIAVATVSSIDLNNKIAFKPAKDRADDGSGSERGTSLDRNKGAENVSKQDFLRSFRSSVDHEKGAWGRRGNDIQRKEQLIEALSVPVQSEKAMKMMLKCGWKGGALGARGNGITEPIMPAIDRRYGAGLGHAGFSKTIKKPKTGNHWSNDSPQNESDSDIVVEKTKELLRNNHSFNSIIRIDSRNSSPESRRIDQNFRQKVLYAVLRLLTSDATSETLSFMTVLHKRDRIFVKHVLKAFAARTKVSVATVEKELIDTILKKYNELPGVKIKACFSNDCKSIELKKKQTFSNDQMKQINKTESAQTSDLLPNVLCDVNDTNMMAFLDSLPSAGHSKKNFRALKFRVLILLKMLHFIKSEDEEMEINFNKVLPANQKAHIESTVKGVNTRIRFGSTPSESVLMLEIKNHIKDKFLGIMFNHQYTSFTLLKYCRIKRLNEPFKEEPPKKRRTITSINLDNFNCDNSNEGNVVAKVNNTTENNNETAIINKEATDKNKENATANYDDNNQVLGENFETADFKINADEYNLFDPSNLAVLMATTNKKNGEDPFEDYNRDFDMNIARNDKVVVDKKSEEVIVYEYSENKSVMINNSSNKTDNNASIKSNGNLVIDNNDNQVIDIKNEIDDEKVIVYEEMLIDYKEEIIENEEEMVIDDENVIEKTENESKSAAMDLGKDLVTYDGTTKSNSENETDCDDLINPNVDLSEENCDNKHLVVRDFDKTLFKKHLVDENKADSPISEVGNNVLENIYSEIKNVYLVPTKYPNEKLTKEQAKEIQILISDNIENSTEELPLLVAHGIRDGALIYTCHSKKSHDWLKNTISVANYLKMLDIKDVRRMALKFYCLFDFDIQYLFKMIELYNKELCTKNWVVEKKEFHDEYAVFLVKMDSYSVNFIHASDLALFAGVDKIEFSLIWD